MTIAAFRERVLRDVRDGNRYSYGITQVGQFQVYIGVFANRREKSRRPSRTRRLVDGHPQVPTLG